MTHLTMVLGVWLDAQVQLQDSLALWLLPLSVLQIVATEQMTLQFRLLILNFAMIIMSWQAMAVARHARQKLVGSAMGSPQSAASVQIVL